MNISLNRPVSEWRKNDEVLFGDVNNDTLYKKKF